ncbi:MAG TPA: NADH-quinone oxidoreductase subunit H [Tepidiformaceae bacterium]
MSTSDAVILGAVQLLVLAAVAPLLNGLIRKVKARLQYRQGPPLLQNYFDLAKWWSRSEQVAASTSFVHRLAPAGVLATTLTATLFLPVFSWHTPLSSAGDLFVVVALFALGRALLTLGGMDSGSSFGQMGSSREVAVGALVEPILILSLVTLAIAADSTRLGDIVRFAAGQGFGAITPGWALAAIGFTVVLVAETGRIPVDNPDTHLELTMIHEAMLIEYSGRSLGMLHFSALMKQAILVVLLANVFLPFGLTAAGAGGHAIAVALVTGKVAAVGIGLAIVESVMAKTRLFELPDLLGMAAFATLLGAALVVLA